MNRTEMQNTTRQTASYRLAQLGLELPPPPLPVANFVTHVVEGGFIFLSGQGPREPNGKLHRGRVGEAVSTQQAYDHARLVGVNLISVIQAALGDLERMNRVVKVLGMVNSTPDFEEHPQVIDGCSDLFIEVFGDRGQHARSAVGFSSLPGGITVEIEAVVSIRT